MIKPSGWYRLKDLSVCHASHTPASVDSQSMHGDCTVSPAVKARWGSNDMAPWMIIQRQSNGLGRHCPRHLCRITHWRHCNRGRCSGQPDSGQQNCQVRWTGQHAHLLSSFHRNRRYLETLGCWACPRNRQTGQATLITGEPRESTFLFQQLSIALQRGNAVTFLNTFDSD